MKIIREDRAYVQYCDIALLMNALCCLKISCPSSVIDTCFKDCFVCMDSNQYCFMEFKDKAAIKFWMDLDYVIDYDTYKDLSKEEIIKVGESKLEERKRLISSFNSMSKEKRKKHYDEVATKCDLLLYQAYEFRHLLEFRDGHIKYPLPEGVDEVVHPSKAKKLILSLFRKNR